MYVCVQVSWKFKYKVATAKATDAFTLECELMEQASNCPHFVCVKKAWIASLIMSCDDRHDRPGFVALTLQVAIAIIK
jgi:hypothetical protein